MRQLPAEADVVVIGAGVTGAGIGYQIARHSQRRVVVVDARAPVGGISGRTFGQIRQHYSNELMVRIAQRGFHCIRNWESEVGFGDPGYVRLGYMLLVAENQLDGLRRNIELGRGLGVDTRMVRSSEISDIEPLVNPRGRRGRRLRTRRRLHRRHQDGAELAHRGHRGRCDGADPAGGGGD